MDPREWTRIIFSDEERFCLDGLDGCAHHWADKRVGKADFALRQGGAEE